MLKEINFEGLRYAYQIVRLAHYAQDYELALKMYDFALPKISNKYLSS